jgi:hypothetical protein
METTSQILLSKKEQDKLKELYQQVQANETLNTKDKMAHQCATCKRYKMENGNFKELSELSANVRREAQRLYSDQLVSHTMCQSCYDEAMEKYKKEKLT